MNKPSREQPLRRQKKSWRRKPKGLTTFPVLAHADTKELPKGAVEDIGWGLAGLGEIGFDLACLSQFTKKEARHDHEA